MELGSKQVYIVSVSMYILMYVSVCNCAVLVSWHVYKV